MLPQCCGGVGRYLTVSHHCEVCMKKKKKKEKLTLNFKMAVYIVAFEMHK